MQNPQRFDVGIKALIEGPEGVLIVKQSETAKWEFVGGRINVGEENLDQREILKREIEEELGPGFDYSIEKLFSTGARSWDAGPRKGDYVFLVAFLCKFKGGAIVLSSEHTEFAWVTKNTINNYDFFPDYSRMLREYWEIA